ncbi:DUF1707 SHOCT-like domain-containing protein [Actinocorallia populi]|uniref:DUF1707 SHOCT-like domain-containing protein n=1 Tax=Actinocorallia populi TaxID=2079200 RepID=UPI000D089583|nr:DUF1707 domain-containing protein [Actinocorallia populi]
MHRHHHPAYQRIAAARLGRLAVNDDRPDLRIGDAERTAVTEALQRHYAEGRLDGAELEERLDRALAARTEADLTEIVHDLPGPRPWRTAPEPRGGHPRPRHRGSRFLMTGLLLGAVLLAIAVVTGFPVVYALVRILFLALLFGLFFRHLRRIWSR